MESLNLIMQSGAASLVFQYLASVDLAKGKRCHGIVVSGAGGGIVIQASTYSTYSEGTYLYDFYVEKYFEARLPHDL